MLIAILALFKADFSPGFCAIKTGPVPGYGGLMCIKITLESGVRHRILIALAMKARSPKIPVPRTEGVPHDPAHGGGGLE